MRPGDLYSVYQLAGQLRVSRTPVREALLRLAEAGVIGNLRDSTTTLGATAVDTSRSLAEIAEEHAPILDALAAHSPDRAGDAVHAHLARTAHLLLGQLGVAWSDFESLATSGRLAGTADPPH